MAYGRRRGRSRGRRKGRTKNRKYYTISRGGTRI